MNETLIYPISNDGALGYAVRALRHRGIAIADTPDAAVTHALLNVPYHSEAKPFLHQLPSTVTVIGGNLNLPEWACMDLLKDEEYLAKNAMITAQIAMNLAFQRLPVVPEGCPVLILGWGRIGKCLYKLLNGVGAEVTVATRKSSDRAMVRALGGDSRDIHTLKHILRRFRVIFNTIPHPVLDAEQMTYCRPDCVKLELASSPGIAGADVIQARGLPGKYAPESSGTLIAETILRLLAKEVVL